jgi:tetratricopeptide (TPR) repeat protein
MRLRTSSVVPLTLLLLAPVQPPSASSLPDFSEFPQLDGGIASLERVGLIRMEAERRLATAPYEIETLRLLGQADMGDELLASLRHIVDARPERIPDAFAAGAFMRLTGDDARTRRQAELARTLVSDARAKLSALSREDAARAELALLGLPASVTGSREDHQARMERFVVEHRGTAAALGVEASLISRPPVSEEVLGRLETFAAAHPATVAAAQALFQEGSHLASSTTLGLSSPRDDDPLPRFERVRAIVARLESGDYPPCEWVERAATLLTQFFVPDRAPIEPATIDHMIEVYRDAAVRLVDRARGVEDLDGLDYLLSYKVPGLLERKGERAAGTERLLIAIEQQASNTTAARYLRVRIRLAMLREKPEAPPERAAAIAGARRSLEALSAEGTGPFHRHALATLAALDFSEQGYGRARVEFERYAAAYPESSWTWVALLRTGQCAEALDDPRSAAAAYAEVAARFDGLPLARVLGHEYAARALEQAGDFDRALEQHRLALASWDNRFPAYTTYVRRSRNPGDPFAPSVDTGRVVHEELEPRIAELTRSLALPGGAVLERGRALMAARRYGEAADTFQEVLDRYSGSASAADARTHRHEAHLARALSLAEGDAPDIPATARMLDVLAAEPTDFPVTAARIARASLFWTRGRALAAESAMRDALAKWQAGQPSHEARTDLEKDVAAIRQAVFLPAGGGVYGGDDWNAFEWPAAPPPYVLVNADVRVKLADGVVSRVTVTPPLPARDGPVLYLDTAQIASLKEVMIALGGTRRREPRFVMETPNQPVGDSVRILQLWTKFFPARPGHWGGWEVETYPVITDIEFTDAGRTRAAAKVTVGYSGGTVDLEKSGDRWVAVRLTNRWIT